MHISVYFSSLTNKKMFKFFVYSVALCATITICQGLSCETGVRVESSVYNLNEWNNTECPIGGLPQRCIRARGKFLVLSFLETNVTGGFCVNATDCNDTCRQLAKKLIKGAQKRGISVGSLDLNAVTFNVINCDKICCDTDNCNNATVTEIRKALAEKGPIISPERVIGDSTNTDMTSPDSAASSPMTSAPSVITPTTKTSLIGDDSTSAGASTSTTKVLGVTTTQTSNGTDSTPAVTTTQTPSGTDSTTTQGADGLPANKAFVILLSLCTGLISYICQ